MVTARQGTKEKPPMKMKRSLYWPSKHWVQLFGNVVFSVFNFCVAQSQHNVGIWLAIWISWAEVKCLLGRKTTSSGSFSKHSVVTEQLCGFPAWFTHALGIQEPYLSNKKFVIYYCKLLGKNNLDGWEEDFQRWRRWKYLTTTAKTGKEMGKRISAEEEAGCNSAGWIQERFPQKNGWDPWTMQYKSSLYQGNNAITSYSSVLSLSCCMAYFPSLVTCSS